MKLTNEELQEAAKCKDKDKQAEWLGKGADPDCPKCYGRGYSGYNTVNRKWRACKCVF